MIFGERIIQRGMKGDDVRELQIRLAGFRGTLPDGDFGPGTEMQVTKFQADFMGMDRPTGVVDRRTFVAIDELADSHPIDFDALHCPCGICGGFGQGRLRNRYATGAPRVEAFHRYEYPGIHRMLLWAVRALFFYSPEHDYIVTSGYRCGERNKQTRRTSTNHHGKAIDLDVPRQTGEDGRDDMIRCDGIRGLLVERSHAQVGWTAGNRKALEPAHIAPTWVHYDVRCYDRKYLHDDFFCQTPEELDARTAIMV